MQEMIAQFKKSQKAQGKRIKELDRELQWYRKRQAEFAPFKRLPPELRRYIWRLVVPLQIFRPFRNLEPSLPQWKSLLPPTISRVCREARHVAYEEGALYCHDFLAPARWTWFNGRKDVLDLSSYCIGENGFIPLQDSLLHEARTIIIDVGIVNELSIAGLNSEWSHLDNVEAIYLAVAKPFEVQKRTWQPHAVARLFGHRSFAIVDVEDEEELERLEDILETSCLENINFMGWWHTESVERLQEQVRPPPEKKRAWKEAKEQLLKGYKSRHDPPPPLIDIQIEGEEATQHVARLPTVKLVQTFELTPSSRYTPSWMHEGITG
ncbi:hypothetical protein ACQKWADRAFT_322503 [Trichoderma austrokoningii]